MGLAQLQQQFIDRIKDPNQPLPADTDARHMQIYQDLFFNNMEGFVASAFPVLKTLYREAEWLALIRDFFIHHDCSSPIFADIAAEFLSYLNSRGATLQQQRPFILELAHYEHLELVVSIAQDDEGLSVTPLLQDSDNLVLAPSAKLAQYHFEVQRICVDFQPQEAAQSPQFFCVYRDLADDVQFLALVPMTAMVLAYLADHPGMTLSQIQQWALTQFDSLPDTVINQGIVDLLTQLAQKGIVRCQG
ncbi:DUF2063 domain-containing protein [Shewanella sp. NFH-SH190041]|uniref:HvfC family RiPP maturation protein n=1 Tax=Shewanella sp. NFH-SH190041 TaxID=2950245 RepID=UPI0021C2F141|nr:putative DNA-binding domain-containing protein [Shewanella sp. NFH-SH190041]BDM63937.1 DUF2063 domain-containing protein [Shewanella sp. NFH-SH190041]